MNADQQIQQAMHALADAPVPVELAHHALRRAARRRRTRTSLITVAAAVAIVATTATLSFGGAPPSTPQATIGPSDSTVTATTPTPRPCVSYTAGAGDKPIDPSTWPDFVDVVVNGLLAGGTTTVTRADFRMSSGYAWCGQPNETARAVLGLGPNDEAGLLVIEMYSHIADNASLPARCADVNQNLRANQELLFCDEPTPTSPLSYGMTPSTPVGRSGEDIAVIVVHPDRRVVTIELNAGAEFGANGQGTGNNGQGLAFTVEQLRTVIRDPGLSALIPK